MATPGRPSRCYRGMDGSAVILSDLACVFVVWPSLFWVSFGPRRLERCKGRSARIARQRAKA